ncbi:hypothetical protein [Streptomyces sp. CBMA156]|uniref:hypothetical protein n=1 Tax=Streptomyces sp. CBMA156 TaxID=1930280 RepID=UPI001661B0BB|nr:hypothetical protein [Streptomyces sp. CBMA156]MBD0670411.1 hypothetical protein [Streptomyces sp. CBMA156]
MNSDVIVGVNADALNRCITAVYTSNRDGFKGSDSQGGVSVSWDVTKPPTVAVVQSGVNPGWDNATDANGNTPPQSSDSTVIRVTLPAVTAQVGSDSKDSVTGVDITVYMDVTRDHDKFKPTALAADLSGAKLSAWDAEALTLILPVLIKAANDSLPGFGLPNIGQSQSLPKARGTYSGYLILGATSTGSAADVGQLENIDISSVNLNLPTKDCVVVVNSSLYAPLVKGAVSKAQGNMGLGQEGEYSKDNADVRFVPGLRDVRISPENGSVIDVYIEFVEFVVTASMPVDGLGHCFAHTNPAPFPVPVEIAELTENNVTIKIDGIPSFDTSYEPQSDRTADYNLAAIMNNGHTRDPYNAVQSKYGGQTYTLDFALPLEVNSGKITVVLSPESVDGAPGYLVVGAALKVK